MRKPLKTNAWTRYRKGLCHDCWARCCHGWNVEASIPDMIRLGLLKEAEASTDLLGAVERIKKLKLIRSFNQSKLIFVLSQKKNGDCIFLNDQRTCTVYEARPEICRQFPKIGARPNHCPYEPKAT